MCPFDSRLPASVYFALKNSQAAPESRPNLWGGMRRRPRCSVRRGVRTRASGCGHCVQDFGAGLGLRDRPSPAATRPKRQEPPSQAALAFFLPRAAASYETTQMECGVNNNPIILTPPDSN